MRPCAALEITTIDGLPPPGPVKGWATWKGDELYDDSLHATKTGLLIGYDLMSLTGIDFCEIDLADRGIAVLPTAAEIALDGEPPHCLAATIRGSLVPHMLQHSVCASLAPFPDRPHVCWGKEATLKTTAGYLAHLARDTFEGKATLGDAAESGLTVRMPERDWRTLYSHWCSLWGRGYMDRSAYARIQRAAWNIMERIGVEQVHLRYRKIDPSEVPADSGVLDPFLCGAKKSLAASQKGVPYARR